MFIAIERGSHVIDNHTGASPAEELGVGFTQAQAGPGYYSNLAIVSDLHDQVVLPTETFRKRSNIYGTGSVVSSWIIGQTNVNNPFTR